MKKLLPILFSFLALPALSQSTNGLIAHWPFNGNALDSTGNGHNGTMNNTVFTTGKGGVPGSALRFQGSDTSYVTAPYKADLNLANYSLCAVIKPEGFYTNLCQTSVLLTRGDIGNNGNYYFDFFDNAFDSSCANADTQKYVFHTGAGAANSPDHAEWQYSPNTHLNQWYSVVTTFDGDSFKVYVNGVLKSAATPGTPSPVGTSTDSVSIGLNLWDAPYPYWFKGVIDDLRIYNRVLADSEIVSYHTLGIDDDALSNNTDLTISPNPTTGDFTLQGNIKGSSAHGAVEVMNITGQIVYRRLLNITGNRLSERISLNNDLPNGLYILVIKAGEETRTLKFVVER
ncbi:MAG: LamG protein [Flavipsychrobacter sp.]|nr:LamG protein [Flavipsychrobacter sp.]